MFHSAWDAFGRFLWFNFKLFLAGLVLHRMKKRWEVWREQRNGRS